MSEQTRDSTSGEEVFDWAVELCGDERALTYLSTEFQSPNWQVVQAERAYLLTSALFAQQMDREEVRQRSQHFIQVLKSSVNLLSSWVLNIALGKLYRIYPDGTRKAEGSTITIYGDLHPLDIGKSVQEVIETSIRETTMADALRYYSYQENRWFNLYKVFEVIGADLGSQHKIEKRGWATKREISSFTQTAQSPTALGDKARHAVQKEKAPNLPMSIIEAEALIKRLLGHWLGEK